MKINRRQMLGILTVIVSKSPDARDAAELAVDSLGLPPVDVQPLYNEAAARALSDQTAAFTPQEERLIRALIAPVVERRPASPPARHALTQRYQRDEPRTAYLHVRVTPAERQQLDKAARAAGFPNLSDYVRATLGLPHTPPSTPAPTPPRSKR